MNRYIAIASLGLFMCLVSPGCDSAKERPQETMAVVEEESPETLQVTAWPKITRVQILNLYDIILRVVNATAKPQSFEVIGCWEDSWKISNPRVLREQRNATHTSFIETIRLEPGEAYENTLGIGIGHGPPLTLITFRMGFAPLNSKKTYWSNKVILGIKPGKGK